ncbi:MAG: hypothetical protein HY656_00660 [Acidobacteria bacterium]|nr:hypothetical protein [Acidobacteriota bacterium]
MSKADLKVELVERYCPICRIGTQHAILYQMFFGRRGKLEREEELSSACAICNPDRFWGLKLTTQYDQQKFLLERWMPRGS